MYVLTLAVLFFVLDVLWFDALWLTMGGGGGVDLGERWLSQLGIEMALASVTNGFSVEIFFRAERAFS